MAKEKRPKLKDRDPYKYHRNTYWGLKAGRWVSVIAPFIGIFIAKFNEYFVVVEEGTRIKMSIGLVLLIAVVAVVILRETKTKSADGKVQATSVSTTIGWGVAFAIAYLFQAILKDLTLILGLAFAGQALGLIFDLFADNQHFLMTEFRREGVHARARRAEALNEERSLPTE